MKSTLLLGVFVLTPFLLCGCGGGNSSGIKTQSAGVTTTPTVRQWILCNAYSSADGNIGVFQFKRMSDGTTQAIPLTSGASTDWLNPKLSPDHTTVAVTRYVKTGAGEKTVVTFPLATPTQIKTIAGSATLPCEDPSWSPDGTHIVYKETRSHTPYKGDIIEVDSSGGHRNVITSNSVFTKSGDTKYECSVPSYSRNDGGHRIAF